MRKQMSNKVNQETQVRKGENNMKKLLNNKGMASVTTALVVGSAIMVLGTAGGVIGYNVYQEKKYEQEVATFLEGIDTARNNTVNDYNTRVEQALAELTFTDENGEAVTLDNNRNIDSMNNVINSINALISEISSNELLSQEQKDELIQSLNEKINSINGRIETVNEENRIAEEQRIAAEEAAKAERAKAEKNAETKSQKKSGSSQKATGSSESSSEGSSSDGRPRWIDLGDGYGKYENEGGAWVEAHPEYGWNKRFYDRTGIFAAAVKMKEEHPNASVHIYGMGIDQTL